MLDVYIRIIKTLYNDFMAQIVHDRKDSQEIKMKKERNKAAHYRRRFLK